MSAPHYPQVIDTFTRTHLRFPTVTEIQDAITDPTPADTEFLSVSKDLPESINGPALLEAYLGYRDSIADIELLYRGDMDTQFSGKGEW